MSYLSRKFCLMLHNVEMLTGFFMCRRGGEEEMVQRASIELKRVVSLCLLWESFVVYFIS